MDIVNTQPAAHEQDADALLAEFAVAQTAAGGASLAEWSARYPDSARDFARLAADLWTPNVPTHAAWVPGLVAASPRTREASPFPSGSPSPAASGEGAGGVRADDKSGPGGEGPGLGGVRETRVRETGPRISEGFAFVPATAAPPAQSRFQAIGLAALAAHRPDLRPAATPLTSLLAAVKAAGLTPDEAAQKLDLPVALFWKLHRRLLAPDSVPRALIAALADVVDRTREDIAAFLRMPPQLAAGASYRADAAPVVGAQEAFADALNTEPEATPEQRRRWLDASE